MVGSKTDLKFSHVDIVVDSVREFVAKWCPRLGLQASPIQTWGGPEEATWSEFVSILDQQGNLIFMVVEGKRGVHVDIRKERGAGAIYRLCFKTSDLASTYRHLRSHGTRITNIDGEEMTLEDAMATYKILWLEKEGELSMEILSAARIDAFSRSVFQSNTGHVARLTIMKKIKNHLGPSAGLVMAGVVAGFIMGKKWR